jgi:hypothetical protein
MDKPLSNGIAGAPPNCNSFLSNLSFGHPIWRVSKTPSILRVAHLVGKTARKKIPNHLEMNRKNYINLEKQLNIIIMKQLYTFKKIANSLRGGGVRCIKPCM